MAHKDNNRSQEIKQGREGCHGAEGSSISPAGSPAPESARHHKPDKPNRRIIYAEKGLERVHARGVKRARRILSPQLLLKRFSHIHRFLSGPMGLPQQQRGVVLELLRHWAYYKDVYPKAIQICVAAHCSKSTFWRLIRKFRAQGLIRVTSRYLYRPKAQISNSYNLSTLALLIARYLYETGTRFTETWMTWIQPWLELPGRIFWRLNLADIRAGPEP